MFGLDNKLAVEFILLHGFQAPDEDSILDSVCIEAQPRSWSAGACQPWLGGYILGCTLTFACSWLLSLLGVWTHMHSLESLLKLESLWSTRTFGFGCEVHMCVAWLEITWKTMLEIDCLGSRMPDQQVCISQNTERQSQPHLPVYYKCKLSDSLCQKVWLRTTDLCFNRSPWLSDTHSS